MVSRHKFMIAYVQLLTGRIHGKIRVSTVFKAGHFSFLPQPTAECEVLSDVPSFPGKDQQHSGHRPSWAWISKRSLLFDLRQIDGNPPNVGDRRFGQQRQLCKWRLQMHSPCFLSIHRLLGRDLVIKGLYLYPFNTHQH